ncbi:hypothetical protein [Rhodovarius crocodyli]|jgi:hypothetical protein|uniref:hypothetical protein n=1 Tax=Rhodovarius crocodyli TaxID=1979269 RepID=UPI0013E335AB|nr:hypothetical protein [Rhodovarius crocodyli]
MSEPPKARYQTTLQWLLAGEQPPSEIEAKLNRIEDALKRAEAAMKPKAPAHEP